MYHYYWNDNIWNQIQMYHIPFIYIHIQMYTWIFMYVSIYVNICVFIYTSIYTYDYIHTYMYYIQNYTYEYNYACDLLYIIQAIKIYNLLQVISNRSYHEILCNDTIYERVQIYKYTKRLFICESVKNAKKILHVCLYYYDFYYHSVIFLQPP